MKGDTGIPVSRTAVLHVITRMVKGGAQENTLATVLQVDPARYRSILVTGPSEGPEGSLLERARELGADIRLVPSLLREVAPVADLRALRALIAIMRQERPAVVHTHTSKAGILGRIAARVTHVPVVIHTPHGHIFHDYYGGLKTRLFIGIERLCARYADRLVMLTENERKDHLDIRIAPPDKFVVIHSGVDFARFLGPAQVPPSLSLPEGNPANLPPRPPSLSLHETESTQSGSSCRSREAGDKTERTTGTPSLERRGEPDCPHADSSTRQGGGRGVGNSGRGVGLRSHLGIPPDARVIGTVGRLVPIKGHEHLIAAMPRIRESIPDAHLVLVGSGPLQDALKEQAGNLAVGESVHFAGFRADVENCLPDFDLFCLPSLNEGMGRVIVEAMAARLPVVASDVSGIRDLVHPEENGLLVPAGDPEAIASACIRVLADNELALRFGEAGFRTVVPAYSVENMIALIEGLYGEMLVVKRLRATGAREADRNPPAARPPSSVPVQKEE